MDGALQLEAAYEKLQDSIDDYAWLYNYYATEYIRHNVKMNQNYKESYLDTASVDQSV